MKGTLSLKTAPVTEPISVAEAKAHMRVDISDDDTLIAALITAARRWIEDLTGIRMVTQTWYYYLDAFPCEDVITLPIGPVSAVSSVKYTPSGGVQTTFSGSIGYETDLASLPARIALKSGQSWPADTLNRVNGVCIEFVAGYVAVDSMVAARADLTAAVALVAAAITAPEITAAKASLSAATIAVSAAEAAAITAIPEDLRSAVKILVARLYEDRLDLESVKNGSDAKAMCVNNILSNYRMWQRRM